MRREDKYPDTKTFKYRNVNPKKRITGDCVTRAIVGASGIDYNDAVMEMARVQCETGYAATVTQGIAKMMERMDWLKCKQPRHEDNTKFTGAELCEWLNVYFPSGDVKGLVLSIGGHHMTCIVPIPVGTGKRRCYRYVVQDIWDCTYKSVGTVWIDKADLEMMTDETRDLLNEVIKIA